MTVPENLVDFVESGVSILVGTCGADRRPIAARGFGARVAGDRRAVTVYLPDGIAARTLASLREHPEIAVAFSRPFDSFSFQLKGPVTAMVGADEADRAPVERYLDAYREQLYLVGIPRSITRRLQGWPATAVTFAVREIFVQTPGPDAGKPLEAR